MDEGGPFRTAADRERDQRCTSNRELFTTLALIFVIALVIFTWWGWGRFVADYRDGSRASTPRPFCTGVCETYGFRPVSTFREVCGVDYGASCVCGDIAYSLTWHCDGRVETTDLP